MVEYKCFRCGFNSKIKTCLHKHIHRKFTCEPSLQNIDISEIYEFYFKCTDTYVVKNGLLVVNNKANIAKNTENIKNVAKNTENIKNVAKKNNIDILKCKYCDQKFKHTSSRYKHQKSRCAYKKNNEKEKLIDNIKTKKIKLIQKKLDQEIKELKKNLMAKISSLIYESDISDIDDINI